jgi:two-component system, NarL family, sensor kinase
MRSPLARRSAVLQFAVSGLLATVLIGLGAVAVIQRTGTREAIRDAKRVTRLAGEGIVEPNLTPGVLAADPPALARLDRLVRSRVLRDGIVRVKLWTPDGRIVYSDEPRLVGERYALDVDDRATLRTGRVEADVSDLSRPENRFERADHKLLEVYLPVSGPHGQRLLFEAYQRFGSVSASGRRLWLAFAPALIGGLLLLQLVNLPLGRSLVRQRERLLRRAIDASELERRRIAADLHDGVVQDLVGVSYALSAAAERNRDTPAADALRDGAARARDSVRALRALLVDIYPPSLHQAGLLATLNDLAGALSARGLSTKVTADGATDFPPAAEALLFRCAQEALRNAVAHADASHVAVTLRRSGDRAYLEVADDGRGFDPAVLANRPAEGHFGVKLARDLVRDAGGELTIDSAPGRGTRVRVEVPLR